MKDSATRRQELDGIRVRVTSTHGIEQVGYTAAMHGHSMRVRTVIIDGPIAVHMARHRAATAADLGCQILTVPLLAARLAGGFKVPASQELLLPAIQHALQQGKFEVLGPVADLPGIARAVFRTVSAWWFAAEHFSEEPTDPRVRDFLLLEARVREFLPSGALTPPDLASAALGRIAHAPRIFGEIAIEGVVDIAPVWRPLITALAAPCSVRWTAPRHVDHGWFTGRFDPIAGKRSHKSSADICADPRSEVVEALRWARELISNGGAAAHELAITATQPSLWDDHMLVLSREAGLPVHFSHGIPALATREGQTCAALADILQKGLSQERVRRLFRRLPKTQVSQAIPADWAAGLSRGAALKTLSTWEHALAHAREARVDGERAEDVILPILRQLSLGTEAAEACGALLLKGDSMSLWKDALQSAPARAIDLSLQGMRVSDGRDAANSIVWSPAWHVASSPRRHLRLMGLTGRSWPRTEDDDPILPHHLVDRRALRPTSIGDEDRRMFGIIVEHSETYSLSRAQRSSTGTVQAASALWPEGGVPLGRSRIPLHAFSESDRLFARPVDAGKNHHVRATRATWKSWQEPDQHSPHDGAVRASHPAVLRALGEVQSSTSLQRLLCDPLGYVWEYALGWSSIRLESEPLALDQRAFGELVHALISGTIEGLNATGRRAVAGEFDVVTALEQQALLVEETWPLQRAVPPGLLWRHTVEEARQRALRGLQDGHLGLSGISWSELAFGDGAGDAAPWISSEPVQIGATGLRLRGRMDRVDIYGKVSSVLLTDYKSGAAPQNAYSVVFGQGAELQRLFYALAARTLLPSIASHASRLTYLENDPAASFELSGEPLDVAIESAIAYAAAAADILKGGVIAPGRPKPFFDQLTLALPADSDAYRRAKQRVFARANSRLEKLWGSR